MDAWIADFQRTPVGKIGGKLSAIRPDDLAATVIQSLLERNSSLDINSVEDIILGCSNQAGEDNRNIARFAGLLAGLPVEVSGVTVNRLCASGMQSIIDASMRIRSGMNTLLIAGGVESMSRAPYVMRKPENKWDRNPEMVDTTLGWRFVNPAFSRLYHPFSMGETAENIAEKWKISRVLQDEFARLSHNRYGIAAQKGIWEKELVSGFDLMDNGFADENVRKSSSAEKMAALPTVFRDNGTVTAANASGLNDGAAALLIASDEAIRQNGLRKIARIVDAVVVGVHPDVMGTGPVPAMEKLLLRNGLSTDDIGLFEINEAYAVQVLYALQELKLDPERVNVNGGALAIGHPLGMSGSRITGHLALEMERRNVQLGIASMCVGVGQGVAILLEKNKD